YKQLNRNAMHAKYIIIVIFITLSSCQKYLSIKSNSNLTTPTTLKNLQLLLDDALMNTSVNAWGEASADNYFISEQMFNFLSEIDRKIYKWENYIYNFP